jgi:hypothetical protein
VNDLLLIKVIHGGYDAILSSCLWMRDGCDAGSVKRRTFRNCDWRNDKDRIQCSPLAGVAFVV